MKNKYELYEPSKLIRDFHKPADSYYQSKDVKLSPFTKVGSLADMPEPAVRPNKLRETSATRYAQPAVFSKDFVLPTLGGSRQDSKRDAHEKSQRDPATSRNMLTGAAIFLKSRISSVGTRLRSTIRTTGMQRTSLVAGLAGFTYAVTHFHPSTKKYVAGKGLQRDLSAKAATLGKVVVLGLGMAAVVLLIEVLHLLTGPAFFPSTPKQQSHASDTPAASARHTAVPQSATGNTTPVAGSTASSTANGGGNAAAGASTGASGQTGYSTNTSSSTPRSGAAAPSSRGSTAPTNSALPATGGATSGVAIPGVTYPYPVNVPATTVPSPLDGKQVVGTSPTTITLN